MGIISILLGVIAFFLFTGVGAILANFLVDYKTVLSMSLTSLEKVSNGAIIAVVVGIFAFIGLLICVNLVMAGLNHNKLTKIHNLLKRR
ncbi:MAG: hypothetical protein IJH09_09310 [Clostridia bacterium]|nr:hypothetical protein [Clostridia bacterium]